MREILFRGKETATRWVYGSLFVYAEMYMILTDNCVKNLNIQPISVAPKTVSQFTGLFDKNGKKIYEGDIIRAKIESGNHEGFTWPNMTVDFQQGSFCLKDRNGYVFCVLGAFAPSVTLEVIGNIHDNPELLDKGWT